MLRRLRFIRPSWQSTWYAYAGCASDGTKYQISWVRWHQVSDMWIRSHEYRLAHITDSDDSCLHCTCGVTSLKSIRRQSMCTGAVITSTVSECLHICNSSYLLRLGASAGQQLLNRCSWAHHGQPQPLHAFNHYPHVFYSL